jgi:hypothetical protein
VALKLSLAETGALPVVWHVGGVETIQRISALCCGALPRAISTSWLLLLPPPLPHMLLLSLLLGL